MARGGKQPGAGRPFAPPRPKPVSWRPDSQKQRDLYIALGGAKWLKEFLKHEAKKMASHEHECEG
jgi:hypothetical protein